MCEDFLGNRDALDDQIRFDDIEHLKKGRVADAETEVDPLDPVWNRSPAIGDDDAIRMPEVGKDLC